MLNNLFILSAEKFSSTFNESNMEEVRQKSSGQSKMNGINRRVYYYSVTKNSTKQLLKKIVYTISSKPEVPKETTKGLWRAVWPFGQKVCAGLM